MSRRNHYTYDERVDYVRPRSPSPSPHRFHEFVRAVDDGQFHEAKDIAKSAVVRGRQVEPLDAPVRRYHSHRGDRYNRDETTQYWEANDYPHRRGVIYSRHTADDYHRRRARSHSTHRVAEAATAALAAGLAEAVRARHSPERSRRAVTAAVGAAAMDVLVSKGKDKKQGRHIVESAMGGLLIDRLANGRSAR